MHRGYGGASSGPAPGRGEAGSSPFPGASIGARARSGDTAGRQTHPGHLTPFSASPRASQRTTEALQPAKDLNALCRPDGLNRSCGSLHSGLGGNLGGKKPNSSASSQVKTRRRGASFYCRVSAILIETPSPTVTPLTPDCFPRTSPKQNGTPAPLPTRGLSRSL